jgi:hypothetical protein
MKNQCNDTRLISIVQYHNVGIFKVFYCVGYQLFFNQLLGNYPITVLLKERNDINAGGER